MLRLFLSAGLALFCIQPSLPNVNAQKTTQLSVRKRDGTVLLGKRNPFAISLQNYIPGAEYYVTALIGHPPQSIEFVLDTGSSDIWMFGPGSCDHKTSICGGGEFNISRSKTAKYVAGGREKFGIRYVNQGSGVRGSYFTDDFSIGGVRVTDMVMAVASEATYVPSGIMGIGLARNEASVGEGLGKYPNFPDLLVKQGIIKSKAYSLYLDGIGQSTGMMIFGGYDKEKFEGELTMLPVQKDATSGQRSAFIVSWSSLGVSDSGGERTILKNGNFLFPAVLDTGTTLTFMPSSIYAELATYFRIVPRGFGEPGRIDCNFGQGQPGQLIYGFGGANGTQIAVEFDELVIPLYSKGQKALAKDGQPLCVFGIVDAGSNPILLGQTFLRSAYVLYDLDNLQVGVAQTVFSSTRSNVVEYDGLPAPRVGRVQGPQVTKTATEAVQPIIGTSLPSTSTVAASRASAVPTDYTIASVSYPSETPPASFPTVIPVGPTGRVGFSSGQQGNSGNSGGDQAGKTNGNGNVGSLGTGKNGNRGSGHENQNGANQTLVCTGSTGLLLLMASFLFLLSHLALV